LNFRQKLSKSIKNEIVFEEKLNAEVPKGKNHIIKNIDGKDVVVIKSLEGQNTNTLLNSVLSEHFSSVGFKLNFFISLYWLCFVIFEQVQDNTIK
jgi:hypothetical protein